MPLQKAPFYIIGHQANRTEDAMEFLSTGANSLELDIVHDNGRFYVSHGTHSFYKNIPALEDYLQLLKALLHSQSYNLTLIIWDMKCTDFDPNDFIALVKQNFSGSPCDDVAMLITHPEEYPFINQYKGGYNNVGVGLDESNIPPAQLQSMYKSSGQKNFSYADGITSFLNKTGVFNNITEAKRCRNEGEPPSFSIIYTWVLKREKAMRNYLDTNIDGIMVDISSVVRLKELLAVAPYNDMYDVAQNGYNPFASKAIYSLPDDDEHTK